VVGDDAAPDDARVDGGAPRPRRKTRRRVGIVALVLVVAAVAAIAIWSDDRASGFYVYQPGSAPHLTTSAGCRIDGSGDLKLATGTPCARLLVPADRAHDVRGTILMVDVLVGKATPVQYILHELGLLDHFSRGSQLLPNAAVLGTTPAAQLTCQDDQEMVGATATAPVVALQRLGYKVTAVEHGARVAEVAPGTAAVPAGIECNDLITAVDGHVVKTAAEAKTAIDAGRPGSAITLTVQRTGTGGKSTTHVLHATLGSQPAAPSQPELGIVTADDITYTLPFDVGVDVGDIGGPSAGLALTLGLLDVLSNGNLTGGHTVAVTGTINPDGTVGDVGGVAQKTVAVERAGAQLFLVPPQEYGAAESQANGKMKIEKVATLSQALAALKAIGGQIPPAAT
jgi:PDZ domain-containing protein